jgi:hypothetical protein
MRFTFVILLFCGLGANAQMIIKAHTNYVPFASANLLLDQYSGAAAAYSLRKLRTAYSGNAIRVRRSNDNAEQDIGFDANGNLNETALTTFVGANSGFVTTWYDQSGNARNATQTTAANQPVIVNAGTVSKVNGKPAINHSRSTRSSWFTLPTGFLNGATSLSWIAVLRVINDFNNGVFGPNTTNSVGLEILQHYVINIRSLIRINGTIRNNNAGEAYQLWGENTQNLSQIYGDNSSISGYRNATAITLTNSNSMPALNFNGVYAIGNYSGTNAMSGWHQELIIYTTNQSSNRTGIQNNINTYYSIY